MALVKFTVTRKTEILEDVDIEIDIPDYVKDKSVQEDIAKEYLSSGPSGLAWTLKSNETKIEEVLKVTVVRHGAHLDFEDVNWMEMGVRS